MGCYQSKTDERINDAFDKLSDSHVIQSRAIKIKMFMNDVVQVQRKDDGNHHEMVTEISYYINHEKVPLYYFTVIGTEN